MHVAERLRNARTSATHMKLGCAAVINRSELNERDGVTLAQAVKNERAYFTTSSQAVHYKSETVQARCGRDNLLRMYVSPRRRILPDLSA